MGWRRDEIWFDADVLWFREAAGDRGAVSVPLPPLFFRLAADSVAEIPDGLATSRQRRAELRRRRNARRARAAALVIAPAAVLPVAGQKAGVGPGGWLREDPPSLVRDAGAAAPVAANVRAPRPLERPVEGAVERGRTARAEVPQIDWGRATSHGLPQSGSLAGGTQLPVDGPDWVTWNPVEDAVPNEPHRLYGHERTIRTVLSVLAAYRSANPDSPRAVVGDLSFRHGGPMEQHVSHQNGLDVDVYYPRRDGRLRAPRSAHQIDRELAQDLVDRFVAAGAQKIFVGYSLQLGGPADVVVPYPNHGDHMHVRFPPPG